MAPWSRPGVWETPGHANALREFLAGSMARRGGFYAAGRMGPCGATAAGCVKPERGLPRERARSQQKLKKSKLELFPYF